MLDAADVGGLYLNQQIYRHWTCWSNKLYLFGNLKTIGSAG